MNETAELESPNANDAHQDIDQAEAVAADQETDDFDDGFMGEYPPEGSRCPSPDEIRQHCLEIQTEWSPREKISRSGRDPDKWFRWYAPTVRVSTGAGALPD